MDIGKSDYDFIRMAGPPVRVVELETSVDVTGTSVWVVVGQCGWDIGLSGRDISVRVDGSPVGVAGTSVRMAGTSSASVRVTDE